MKVISYASRPTQTPKTKKNKTKQNASKNVQQWTTGRDWSMKQKQKKNTFFRCRNKKQIQICWTEDIVLCSGSPMHADMAIIRTISGQNPCHIFHMVFWSHLIQHWRPCRENACESFAIRCNRGAAMAGQLNCAKRPSLVCKTGCNIQNLLQWWMRSIANIYCKWPKCLGKRTHICIACGLCIDALDEFINSIRNGLGAVMVSAFWSTSYFKCTMILCTQAPDWREWDGHGLSEFCFDRNAIWLHFEIVEYERSLDRKSGFLFITSDIGVPCLGGLYFPQTTFYASHTKRGSITPIFGKIGFSIIPTSYDVAGHWTAGQWIHQLRTAHVYGVCRLNNREWWMIQCKLENINSIFQRQTAENMTIRGLTTNIQIHHYDA